MRALTPALEAVEDAVLAALRGDATLAARMRHAILDIQSFRGAGDEALAAAVQRQPALLVLYAGTTFEAQGHHGNVGTDTWVVLALASNLRGEADRRRPAVAGDVGAYELVEHILRILAGNDLALDGLGPMEPEATELVETSTSKSGKSLALYQVVFHAEHELREVPPDQDLDALHNTYEVAGADDDGAETWTEIVTDIVTLEE